MSERQREHVKEYRRSLAAWKAKNLGEKMCHDLAAAVAKDRHRLEADEQAAVDAWLDERYPERKAKPKPGAACRYHQFCDGRDH
jgi:hypothetical protein